MNTALRNQEYDWEHDIWFLDDMQKISGDIRIQDSTMEMASYLRDAFQADYSLLDHDRIVFRGVAKSIEDIGVVRALEQGSDLIDYGFVSTTNRLAIALGFGRWADASPTTLFEIIVPKGLRGINVAGISPFSEEEELLLPPGTRFKVIEVITDGKAIGEEFERVTSRDGTKSISQEFFNKYGREVTLVRLEVVSGE